MHLGCLMNLNLCLLLVLAVTMPGCKEEPYVDAPLVLPVLSIDDVSMEEGNDATTFNFALTLDGISLTNAGFRYEILDGTAKGGKDFIGTAEGSVLFGVHDGQKVISVPIITDYLKEDDETFEIRLFDPVNMTLERDHAVGTILNDDLLDQDIYVPETGYTSPESYPGMSLVWRDEFDGDTINPDNWSFDTGTGNNGWGNQELQYYRPENAFLFRDVLVLEARQEFFQGSEYTSARIKTQGKQSFKFGRIDIRAVTPETKGMWPALWMLGTNINQIGWPACGEIDIMELRGDQPNRALGTVHFGGSTAQHQYVGSSTLLPPGEKFSNTFHVFSLVWEQDVIKWLVDDVEYFEFTVDDTGTQAYPFNKSFFFVFNLAVGGTFPGDPDATSKFPQRMLVDYIRVFQ